MAKPSSKPGAHVPSLAGLSLSAPPPILNIKARSHNVWYKNTSQKEHVSFTVYAATAPKPDEHIDFQMLQECTEDMVKRLASAASAIPALGVLAKSIHHSGKKNYGVIVYDKSKYELVGRPSFGSFQLSDGTPDRGRPWAGGVFRHTGTTQTVMVLSVHAPHGNYSLLKNLTFMVDATAANAKLSNGIYGADYVVVGGDFNRDDWTKAKGPQNHVLWTAQGWSPPTYGTEMWLPEKYVNPTQYVATCCAADGTVTLAYDNILFGSFNYKKHKKMRLEKKLEQGRRRGADHMAVTATILCFP